MWRPRDLNPTVKRRALLGVAGTSLTLLAARLPTGRAEATLNATVTLQQTERDDTGDIGAVTFTLENHAPHPIEPVANMWGVGRQTQHPWNRQTGPPELPSGDAARYEYHAPGDHEGVRVHADKPAQLTVFDKGSEARVVTHFVPADHLTETGCREDCER